MTEAKEKNISHKTATEIYLNSLDPELWARFSSMSVEEQDNRWFKLTQLHLKKYYKAEDLNPEAVATLIKDEDFIKEEKEFLMLNHFGALAIPKLDNKMSQIGCILLPEQTKFSNLGDFYGNVSKMIKEKDGKFSIMVGGAGIVGKATTRTVLVGKLLEEFSDSAVLSIDRDYQKLHPLLWGGDINVVEDVHGLDRDTDGSLKRIDGKEGLLGGYDLVIYVLPRAYRQTLLNRGVAWAEAGKIDLTDPNRKLPEGIDSFLQEVAGELGETFIKGKNWYKDQLTVIRELRKRKVPVVITDPTPILKTLGYIRGEDKDISSKSFLELLQKHADMQKVTQSLARLKGE